MSAHFCMGLVALGLLSMMVLPGGASTSNLRDRRSTDPVSPNSLCREDVALQKVRTTKTAVPMVGTLGLKGILSTLANITRDGITFLANGQEKLASLTATPLGEGIFLDSTISLLRGLMIKKITCQGSAIAEKCRQKAFPEDGTKKYLGAAGRGLSIRTIADLHESKQVIRKYSLTHQLINVTLSDVGLLSPEGGLVLSSSSSGFSSLSDATLLLSKTNQVTAAVAGNTYTFLCVAPLSIVGLVGDEVQKTKGSLSQAFSWVQKMVRFGESVGAIMQKMRKLPEGTTPALPLKVPFALQRVAEALKQASSGVFWSVLSQKDVSWVKGLSRLIPQALRSLQMSQLRHRSSIILNLDKTSRKSLQEGGKVEGQVDQRAIFIPSGVTPDENVEGRLFVTTDDPSQRIEEFEMTPFFTSEGKVLADERVFTVGQRAFSTNETISYDHCFTDEVGAESCFGTRFPRLSNEKCGTSVMTSPALMSTQCPYRSPPEGWGTTVIPADIGSPKSTDLIVSSPAETTLTVRCQGMVAERVMVKGPGNLILEGAKPCDILQEDRDILLWGYTHKSQAFVPRGPMQSQAPTAYDTINIQPGGFIHLLQSSPTAVVILSVLGVIILLLATALFCACTGCKHGRVYCCIGLSSRTTTAPVAPRRTPRSHARGQEYEMEPLRTGKRQEETRGVDYQPSAPSPLGIRTIGEQILALRTSEILRRND